MSTMNKKKHVEENNMKDQLGGYFGKLPSGPFSKHFIMELIFLLDGLSLVMLLCSSFFKQWFEINDDKENHCVF